MRLSRRVSLLGRRENRRLKKRTKKKHKKLDDICENAYNLNHHHHRHPSVEEEADSNNAAAADVDKEAELRRSTRVRRAPVVLDASPSPAKKRRRVVEFRREKDESGGSWGDRLRDRAKKTKKRPRKRLFLNSDDVVLETSSSRLSTVVKSRVKAAVLKNAHQEARKSSSDDDEGQSSDSKVKSGGSDHEENDEVEKGDENGDDMEESEEGKSEAETDEGGTSESDEDGEERERNEIENHIGEKEGTGDSSESDEDGEESEKNEIENHIGEKEDTRDSSESDEDGEESEKNKTENHIGEKEDTRDSSESDEDGEESEKNKTENHIGEKEDTRDSSESDGDGEEREENEIENHIGKKEDTRDSSESEEEEGEEANGDKDNNKGENEVKGDEEKDEVVVLEDVEKVEVEDNRIKKTDEVNRESDNLEKMELDVQVELQNSTADGENEMDSLNVGGVSTDQIEIEKSNEKHLNDENVKKSLRDTNEKRYLRVGRRCSLCGTGTDGKPPKTLVEDGNDSDHEVAYSGSSASEDVRYDTCDGFGADPGWLGRLLGPINDRHGIAGIFVHQHCAVWSPEVYFAGLNCLKNVRAALFRGRVLKCTRCSRPGATIGCRVDRCPKTYHLPCARANGCIFYHKKFLIACTDHRHLFQPHGLQYLQMIKKMKTKKLKLEMRKVSGDAWRKDHESEEKYLENCGEDEEFLKRESKRLHRDLLRIAPVYIGGSSSDKESQFQGWESVAGLQNVIQSLKEVVILPLLYPEFFSNMGLTPPRGVLLHGYPGTGKTLVVRALIGSCAQGDKRIAYFARKGADCLGKYVGDAERQLRLLFQVAEKSQPSIIFFDEIDGLAPCRTRQQDQTHNSVVSTLLALMDGLKSRGSVVVIGATNRPDSVDPALRRPGRFDREIYFPLPSTQDREAILSLHTRKWPKPVTGSLLKQIARRTVGFAGADLQSLCTQAAITALRRSCPFQEILSAAENNGPLGKHPSLPNFVVEERDWLEALRHAPPPCSQRGTEMAANDVNSSPLHTHLIPCLLQPLSVFLASLCRDKRISLPCPLYKAAMLVKGVVVFALDEQKIPGQNWWSHIHEMLLKADVLRDVEIKLSRCGIINGQASYSSSNVGNEEADGNKLESHCSKMQQISTRPNLWKNATCGSEKKVGFWLLISGSPRSGQRYLASCLLHCFTGNVEIVKLDSATISQEGQGDLMLGVTRILMKCASIGSSLIFMPRIDLWAIETYIDIDGDESDSSMKNSELLGQREDEVSEMATSEDVSQKTSVIWNIFVEQVESISVSSSLTILATSALPLEALPDGIKQFFKSGKSNNMSSSPFEETIPRFSIPLDGQFNYDSVINLSTTELSKDLVQQFVQLTHQRVHIHSSPYTNVKGCDTHTLTDDADNHRPANEVVREQFPESSFTRFSSPANSRPSKGKSSLLLTICTLGYQILRYPHFAELCWATSKLKEGPCTSTRGPWKGWPFNSCIIRPDKSSENVAITSSSSNIKSKKNYGLVRGLIAVGLSAYRGMYTTVREVSSEVRKVLELLADKINAKIRTGKDPYQYIRLLSQMAYFEDVVHSWAYSLQSLEENSQAMIPPTSGLNNLKSRDNKTFEDMTDKKPGGELDVSVKNSEVTAEQKDGCEPAKISDQMLEKSTLNLDLNEPMEEDNQNSEGRIFANEPPEQILLCHSIPDISQHDGNNPDPCTLKTSGNHWSDNGICTPIMPNGFANRETVVINEADLCSGDSGTENPSAFKGFSNQRSEMTQEANISFEKGNSSSIDGRNNVESNSLAGNESSLSNGSMVICFYQCCSECLIKLRETIGKIITYEWGLRDDGDFTVEDVHDLVASVSMNLHSSLRKIFATEDEAEEETKQNNFRGVFENQEKDMCQCKGSEDGFTRLKECRCHSTTNHISQLENDLKFVCRDGVISQLNPEEVTSLNFHCKYETICLCSLIEWIVMTKQPSS